MSINPLTHSELLEQAPALFTEQPHREEDKYDDLYTVLNVIQENLLRGNISGTNKETGRRFTSRDITSIGKDVDVNQGLWNIAERIASIKVPSLAMAA